MSHLEEVSSGARFEFGANWERFLDRLDEGRIRDAEASLRKYLEVDDLQGKTFLDVGSGSGLFSLAARRLGATVTSFDYDPRSVACTRELRTRYDGSGSQWDIQEGSVLDPAFLSALPPNDVVYSWGVLHHTGALWEALANAAALVRPGGTLFVALYNDQGWASRVWATVKKVYNALPVSLRWIVVLPAFARIWGPRTLVDALRLTPFRTWRLYASTGRGMSPWRDVIDWVGGYPFEVAKPEEVLAFLRPRGFVLQRLATCGSGRGCNEFVFARSSVSAP